MGRESPTKRRTFGLHSLPQLHWGIEIFVIATCRGPSSHGNWFPVFPATGLAPVAVFAVPIGQRDELLAAVSAHADHHQQAHLGLLQGGP